MGQNPIDETVKRDELSGLSNYQDSKIEGEPEPQFWRKLRRCIPPAAATREQVTIDDARSIIFSMIDEYRHLAQPEHVLLIKALPGIGKTHYAVQTAEEEALFGKLVAYAGPRHDFYADIMEITKRPELWFEWLPRQSGDEQTGEGRTCEYTREISGWMAKGHDAMTFCSGICGWDFINHGCPYYAQRVKQKKHPIAFIQHNHVALGHPLKFNILIGDEDPSSSFHHAWTVPAKYIVPPGMLSNTGIYNLLTSLTGVCTQGRVAEGQDLLERIGGARQVLETLESSAIPWDALAEIHIHTLEEAELAGYFHLPRLAQLLQREARLADRGLDYVHRLYAGNGCLVMLLKHQVSSRMPAHRIWLDATGNERIYRNTFEQPIKVVDLVPRLQGSIVVVTDRANGKQTLVDERNITKVNRIISKISADNQADKIGVVTFQNLIDDEEKLLTQGNREVLNFYGARGTNRLQDIDILFVVGTPMPRQTEFTKLAAMTFFDRDRLFDATWSSRYIPYNYVDDNLDGWEYPASGFWHDADMQALLWQLREAEIIQAVHRARPLLRPVNVYLLTNLPILQLRVDELINTAGLFDVPDGVDRYCWAKFIEYVSDKDIVNVSDIVGLFDDKNSHHTARKYLETLAAQPDSGWDLAIIRAGSKRPSTGIRRSRI